MSQTIEDFAARVGLSALSAVSERNGGCVPVIQQSLDGGLVYPAIVYTTVGIDSVDSFSNSTELSRVMRFDSRDTKYETTLAVDEELVEILFRSGRVVSQLGVVDDYDPDTSAYRRIRTVQLR